MEEEQKPAAARMKTEQLPTAGLDSRTDRLVKQEKEDKLHEQRI